MTFEKMPSLENSFKKEFEDSMERIKSELLGTSDKVELKKLNDEFIELWKKVPAEISDEAHDNIDEIRSILMDKLV